MELIFIQKGQNGLYSLYSVHFKIDLNFFKSHRAERSVQSVHFKIELNFLNLIEQNDLYCTVCTLQNRVELFKLQRAKCSQQSVHFRIELNYFKSRKAERSEQFVHLKLELIFLKRLPLKPVFMHSWKILLFLLLD